MQNVIKIIAQKSFVFFNIICFGFLLSGFAQAEETLRIRVGHFPTVTHAQGVIGHALTRKGGNWFESRLGPNIAIDWYVYNAGPSVMEALFIDSLDLTYVGPGPTINAYVRSNGEEIKIVAGACSGGSSLVVQENGSIKSDADFKGKIVGTPQYGNTQDIAARIWLKSKGYNISLQGGDVKVIPTANPDQLTQFQRGFLDAVWSVEPWISRLELEAGAKIYLEEKDLWKETNGKYVTTHLVSSTKFLKNHGKLLKKWIAAHLELTEWIVNHPEEAKELFNEELKAEIRHPLPKAVLDKAWSRIELTYDPIKKSLFKDAENAYEIGFLKKKPDLTSIYDLKFLNEILIEKGLKGI